ncbi:MAG: ABC transporter permease [Opitutae bacterium]|nr:ABC transporter permease [Opitutae bacterium]
MNHPRWQKLRGDLRAYRGRVALMVLALAAGLLGVTAMLTAYTILTREIARNYLATNPASATLELERVDPALVAQAAAFPGIAEAEARGAVVARVRVGADWLPLLLFVIDDFAEVKLNRFAPEAGAWPPPDGSLLLERSAVAMLQTEVGGALWIKTPHGAAQAVPVAGLVHDPGLAPSWQERTGYAYITRATLARLGEPPVLEELRIRVTGAAPDAAAINATAQRLAAWLRARGQPVHSIQIPPPRMHPHQTQMNGVLWLFITFSLLTLALSAVMAATVVAGMLAGQVRAIGMMKAVGARTRQIVALYVVLLIGLGGVAVALGLPAGWFVGRKFAGMIAVLLNFTLGSMAVPGWVFAVVVAAGLLLPLLAASGPILRGSRLTVRAALSDYGANAETFGQRGLDRWAGALGGLGSLRLLALRNLLRRRGRLALALGLLAASGGLFMTGLNLKEGWRHMVSRVYADRFYDVEIRLNEPESVAKMETVLRRVPAVRTVEAWGYSATALAHPGQTDVAHTYPDGGHGSFMLLGVPASSRLVRFPLLAGRWLRPDDTDAVVLNHLARALVPGVAVGQRVLLSVGGRAVEWRVVGIVEEVGSPAAAYVNGAAYALATGTTGRAQMLRLASSTRDPAERTEVIRRIEAALADAGVSVRTGLPLAELKTAIGDHVAVLIGTLVATATLVGLIGGLGLAATMSMNVMERTRELGVMKAIGARPAAIRTLIVQEGIFIGAASWLLAVPLSLGLSQIVGRIVGLMSFKVPLALVPSVPALFVWLAAVILLSALASSVPAWRAARLTVREALAHT